MNSQWWRLSGNTRRCSSSWPESSRRTRPWSRARRAPLLWPESRGDRAAQPPSSPCGHERRFTNRDHHGFASGKSLWNDCLPEVHWYASIVEQLLWGSVTWPELLQKQRVHKTKKGTHVYLFFQPTKQRYWYIDRVDRQFCFFVFTCKHISQTVSPFSLHQRWMHFRCAYCKKEKK